MAEKHPSAAKQAAEKVAAWLQQLQKRASAAEQAAEKVLISPGEPERHTSGAEAHMDIIGFMPGINPRPTARVSFSAGSEACVDWIGLIPGMNPRPTARRRFSAACKAHRLFSAICGTSKAVPFQNPTFTTGCSSIFGNGEDRNLIAFPPIRLKNAETIGARRSVGKTRIL